MCTKTFTSGRIRTTGHDAGSGQLDLHWDNGTVTAYKKVPVEACRRLCSAPHPANYWEDRIAEDYPKATPKEQASGSDPAQAFNRLLGDAQRDGAHPSNLTPPVSFIPTVQAGR
jgi:hypothetical protein